MSFVVADGEYDAADGIERAYQEVSDEEFLATINQEKRVNQKLNNLEMVSETSSVKRACLK